MTVHRESAASPALGIMLLLAVTMVLAGLVLLMVLWLPHMFFEPEIPAVFQITNIRHTDKNGQLNDEGWVVLRNSGSINYQNWDLYVLTYVNGKKIAAEIPTLNAYEFANTVNHNGVHLLEGSGSSGSRKKRNAIWVSGASLAIDYSNHVIHPDDIVTLEIYNATSHKIISRDSYPHREDTEKEKMMRIYLSRQGV